MSEESIKNTAYYKLFGGLIIIFISAVTISAVLPEEIYSIPKYIFVGLFALIGWLIYLTKMIPRCHKCGYGVFSVLEIKGVPLIAKSTISKHCSNCGAELK